ncbi:MAG: hypothetical protein NC393_10280 [Clostridium sp.]|nr:hypothetical protein [Clostridium sp.]MCM1207489.1 hypothetical protein [Ruminococcus sp.]
MIVYYENSNGNLDIEVYNGVNDLIKRVESGSDIDSASHFMLRSGEMVIEKVLNSESLVQIASEILRTENACTGVDTYWKPSNHFRSKEAIAAKIREVLDTNDERLVTEVMISMLQSSFYDDVSDAELEDDICTAYNYVVQ